ncbi:vomeronasal type-1 receptor 4-like [Manis pentadactyla]|uniref:vomeronasal type-1 receptor 4-like n=1 Tax=Manis pentadactyla TaxID=143292 RepID=UPI00255C5B99|nr:vomeronasal type-1 receptor 4-like [Manis pentadactyla]
MATSRKHASPERMFGGVVTAVGCRIISVNDCCNNLKENLLNDKRACGDLAMGIILLSQTTVGISGNFSLLYHYLFLHFTGGRLRLTDLILKHLILGNSLVILSKGVSQTLAAFGLKHLFSDLGCKLLLYVSRVGRGVSMGATCLLSVFWAVRISPVNSSWKTLQVNAPKCIVFSISLCWIMYVVGNAFFPIYVLFMSREWNSKNMTKKRHFGYCTAAYDEQISGSVYAALVTFPEVSLSGLMLWASGYMVLILHRHKQRVQHIHSTNVSPRSSAESRATQRVLVLGSTFVCFYFLSSIFHICVASFKNLDSWGVTFSAVISVCFPTVSPYLLMSWDCTVSRLCFVRIRDPKPPYCTRTM